MTLQQKYAALKTYYEQRGHSAIDAARFANNALLLIGLDIPLGPEVYAALADDFQLYFSE